MKAREAQIKNFFQNVEAAVREAGGPVTELARWEVRALPLSLPPSPLSPSLALA